MKNTEGPEIVDKSAEEIESIIAAINKCDLPEHIKTFVIKCIHFACWLPMVIQKQKISMSRLKKMIFGKGYRANKNKRNKKDDDGSGNAGSSSSNSGGSESSTPTQGDQNSLSAALDESELLPAEDEQQSSSGKRGRYGHEVYQDYQEVQVNLNGFKVGDRCPQECGGRLYPMRKGVVVRIDGHSMAHPTKYIVERLRCNVCHYYLAAELPPVAQEGKYSARFKAHLAAYKFYLGIPYHRLASYQSMLGCPLADSTQWGLIEALASDCYAVFESLQYLAANGKLIYNDDTSLRILEQIAAIKAGKTKRTGMYTTCIMGEHEGHKIALYLNGVLHSGEHVDKLLKRRDKEQSLILQMSDALSANTPRQIATLACYCLSHGFRKFEELKDFFPAPCLLIMRELSKVFKIDKKTRRLSADKRLAYHQKHSQPILFSLYKKIETLLASPKTEPNGELAVALTYLKTHWVKLSRFLSVAGAPIDNNIVERALKLAIRVRKSSYFYKTRYSASLSGMLTSLIYTCELSAVNPIDYLTKLQQHRDAVRQAPELWLPWNYKVTIAAPTQEVAVPTTRANAPPPTSSHLHCCSATT